MPLEFYATTTAALRKIIKQDTEFPQNFLAHIK